MTLAESGVFAPADTTKRHTLRNMHDTAASQFYPEPEGPFESTQPELDQSQQHWREREIQLKNPLGHKVPPSTYRDHYPSKGPLPQEDLPDETSGGPSPFPFESRSTYRVEFAPKPFGPRPVEPMTCTHRPAPWLLDSTTNQDHYRGPPLTATCSAKSPPRLGRPVTLPPAQIPNTWETTHKREFTPKSPPGRAPVGTVQPRPKVPWMAGDSTLHSDFTPKEMTIVPSGVGYDDLGNTVPFSGTTEYKDQFQPKEAPPPLPPLTGFLPKNGLQLPLPRKSLGVQFWHKGVPDRYYVLIPRTLDVPCKAKRVFTTLHDNQDVTSIHILYGDSPIATENQLLGQFDLVNIPAAPREVPQIEVTFHLDKDSVLTVTARDLDTQRQKQWSQRGEVCILAGQD